MAYYTDLQNNEEKKTNTDNQKSNNNEHQSDNNHNQDKKEHNKWNMITLNESTDPGQLPSIKFSFIVTFITVDNYFIVLI